MGGISLLDKYSGSLLLLLNHAYPNYEWLPWKFDKCPQNYWDDLKNQRKFMDWAATQLNIKEMEDWYKISLQVFTYTTLLFDNMLRIWKVLEEVVF